MHRSDYNTAASACSETIALVLAGGAGTRLKSLTQKHAKPAVNFAGKYRTIDFSLTNCLHSGLRRISILTQYKSHSLNTHIQHGWNFLRPELNEYVELLPAQQRVKSEWYAGTADAVFQNIDIIAAQEPRYVMILAGDHVYKMDYRDMLQQHIRTKAMLTIGCVEVPLHKAREFGVMEIDNQNRVIGFEEKPARPKPVHARSDQALASMGIYVFSWPFLRIVLQRDAEDSTSNHDFGKNIIPSLIDTAPVFAHCFKDKLTGCPGYWRDVGTIDGYFDAHMELLAMRSPFELFDSHWPVLTYQPQLPPTQFTHDDEGRSGFAMDSIICDGCLITGAQVKRSVISPNVRIGGDTQIENAIILPNVEIGRHCKLRNVIVDQGCRLPEGTVIGQDQAHDRRTYHVSAAGVTVVSAELLETEICEVA